MNVSEATAYLTERGYRCCANTARSLAIAGMIRHYRPGVSGKGRMEFTPGQLDAFLAEAELGGEGEGER